MVFGVSLSHIPYRQLPEALTQREQDLHIQQIARATLLKLGAAMAMNYTVMYIVATDLNFTCSAMLGVATFQMALVAVSVYLTGQLAFHLYLGASSPHHNLNEVIYSSISGHLDRLSLFSLINLLQIAGPLFWIHEGGHALASLACFLNSHPTIHITPFLRGNTEFAISNGFTFLGRLLGRERSLLVVFAAGIAASTAAALAEFGLAHSFQDTHPALAEILNACGLTQLFNDVLYGILALGADRFNSDHDLAYLWQNGDIHPLLPLALMIALPLLQKWFLARRTPH